MQQELTTIDNAGSAVPKVRFLTDKITETCHIDNAKYKSHEFFNALVF